MGFRKLRGVPLPYAKQGQIYFTCLTYPEQPKYTQMKIDKLCESAAGDYSGALFELLTEGESVPSVAQKYFLSIETLTLCRKRFYMLW